MSYNGSVSVVCLVLLSSATGQYAASAKLESQSYVKPVKRSQTRVLSHRKLEAHHGGVSHLEYLGQSGQDVLVVLWQFHVGH